MSKQIKAARSVQSGAAAVSKAATASEAQSTSAVQKQSYKGTQQDLYLCGRLGWENYREHQAMFTEKISPFFTKELTDEQLAFILLTEAKPNDEARSSEHEQARIELEAANTVIVQLFLKGKWYISRAWSDAALVKIKLKAAGNDYLEEAMNLAWAKTTNLINDFKIFLVANNTELLANRNMLSDFPEMFNIAATDFQQKWEDFKKKTSTAISDTSTKFDDNEKIYADLIAMCDAGKLLFKNEALLQKKFIYSDLLRQVRGNKPAGLKGRVRTESSEKGLAKVRINVQGDLERFTVSDEKGKFELKLPSGKYVLEVSAEGYVMQIIERTVQVGVMSRMNPVMKPVVVMETETSSKGQGAAATEETATKLAKLDHAFASLKEQLVDNGALVS